MKKKWEYYLPKPPFSYILCQSPVFICFKLQWSLVAHKHSPLYEDGFKHFCGDQAQSCYSSCGHHLDHSEGLWTAFTSLLIYDFLRAHGLPLVTCSCWPGVAFWIYFANTLPLQSHFVLSCCCDHSAGVLHYLLLNHSTLPGFWHRGREVCNDFTFSIIHKTFY